MAHVNQIAYHTCETFVFIKALADTVGGHLICIQEVLNSNAYRDCYPDISFSVFPQSLQTNFSAVH
jgi:hypothetical protein